MGNNDDGNGGNPGGNPGYVPIPLCAEYRAHIETKIGTMEKSIRWSVYLASSVMGVVLILVEYYLAVIHSV